MKEFINKTIFGPNYRWWALWVVVLAVFMSTTDGGLLTISLPVIITEFNADMALAGWIVFIYALVTGSLYLPSGRMSDLIGRKKSFCTGFLIYAVSSAIAGLSQGPGQLICFRALQAVGRAGSTTSKTCTGGHAIRTDLPRAMGGRDEAPQPVELLLTSLVGCEQATASFVARQMRPRLPLAEIQFLYRAERDNRGAVALPLGDASPEVPARLSRVHGVATVTLNDGESETRERVEYLRRQVELRCPVANMMAAAGIELDIEWVLAAEDACGQ